MSETEATTLDTTSTDHHIEIDTHGRIARSVVELCSALHDEVRGAVSADAIELEWRNPSNTASGNVRLDLDADLDSIEAVRPSWDDGQEQGCGEKQKRGFPIGLSTDPLAEKLRFARKATGGEFGDPVRLRFEDSEPQGDCFRGRTHLTISRNDRDAALTRETAIRNLDPASVIEQPSVEGVEFLWHAQINPQTFAEVMTAFDESHEVSHVQISPGDERDDRARPLVFSANYPADDGVDDEFRVDSGVWAETDMADKAAEETTGSALSLGYLTDIASALKSAKMDRLVISFRDEYLVRFEFGKPAWGLSGTFMVAPRIQSDGEGPER